LAEKDRKESTPLKRILRRKLRRLKKRER